MMEKVTTMPISENHQTATDCKATALAMKRSILNPIYSDIFSKLSIFSENFFGKLEILSTIVENLNFTIYKKVFSKFVGSHDKTNIDIIALWFLFIGPQWTNSNLQIGLRSNGCLV